MAAATSADAHNFDSAGFGTKVIHVGQEPDATTGAVAVPISMSSTFAQSSPGVPSVRRRGQVRVRSAELHHHSFS